MKKISLLLDDKRFYLSACLAIVLHATLRGLAYARCIPAFDGDISHIVDTSSRILAGRIPYLDFIPQYGPLLYYWNTFWFWLAGADWSAGLFVDGVVGEVASLICAIYIAGRMLDRPRHQLLFVGAIWYLNLDWQAGLRFSLPFALLIVAAKECIRGNIARFSFACALTGLAHLLSPEVGAGVGAACLAMGVSCRWRYRDRPGRWFLASLANFLPVVLVAVVAPTLMLNYARTAIGLALSTNWYCGLAFPEPRPSLAAFVYFPPFIFIGATICGSVFGLVYAHRREQENNMENLAIAVFSAVVLRSALGRSDYYHLMFGLIPVLLLWIRFCLRRRHAILLLAVSLLPYAVQNGVDGNPFRGINLLSRDCPPGSEFLYGEGVWVPKNIRERARKVADYIQKATVPGEPVLSLPYPLYAHLARRPQALRICFPDQLELWPGWASSAVSLMDKQRMKLVIVDRDLCFPDDTCSMGIPKSDELAGRLSWFANSDEVATRELRAYLRRNYRLKDTISGVLIFVRRQAPVPSPREKVVSLIAPAPEEAGKLAPPKASSFPVPSVRCDEVRIDISCTYFPGMASFSKTSLAIRQETTDGRITECRVPVPPRYLGRDIRFPAPSSPIRRIELELVDPGGLNPAPITASLKGISFIKLVGR